MAASEISNSELFSWSKITWAISCFEVFLKRSNLLWWSLFTSFYLFSKVFLIRGVPRIFYSFLKSIELFSYNYKNRDFVQFMTTDNLILYRNGRATELQKSANKTLYASSQISPIIFLRANRVATQYTFWVATNAIWWSDFFWIRLVKRN